MNSAQIPFVRLPVDWSGMQKLPIDQKVRPNLAQVTAWGQICRTESAFHVRLQAQEPQILAQEEGPLPMPCNDSCLEFFLRPTPSLRYMNFEWNPKGRLYLGIGTCAEDLMRLAPADWQVKKLFAPQAQQQGDTWQVEFQIPYSFIKGFFPDFDPEKTKNIWGNFYKCGDKLDMPHYLAWNPITREGKYLFNTPEEFGELIFV